MLLTTTAVSNSIHVRLVKNRATKSARKNFDGNGDGGRRPCSALHFGDGCRVENNVHKTTKHDVVQPLDRRESSDNGADDIVTGTNECHLAAHLRITASDKNDGSTDDSSLDPRPRRQWFTNYCGWLPNCSIVTGTDQPIIRQQNRRHHHLHHHHHHTHHLHMWNSSCCWWLLVLYAAIVVVASFARAAHSAKDVPVYHVRAVAGQQARLPCDISLGSDEEDDLSDAGADSPPLDGESTLASGATGNVLDAVLLVLWYRDDLGTPIYSVDARSTAKHTHQEYDSTSYHLMTTGAERWSDQRVFGDRAHFHVNGDSSERDFKSKTNSQKKSIMSTYFSSELRIDRVSLKDAIHLYRCRVDFRLAQTRNSKVNLTVIVPPDHMEIMDLATGRQLLRRQDGDNFNSKDERGSINTPATTSTTVVGPYVEGSNVRVRCRVYGGIPRPRVAWFRDNQLLKPESSDDPDDTNGHQRQEVPAIDGYAAAVVTSSLSTPTGGDNSEEVIEVDLTLTGLSRSDLHTELTCQAWNYFYNDEDYSIIVTNSGSSNIDTHIEGNNMNKEVDPIHWTSRQRQSSLTAVVHVDMNFPPLTVQILPIAENGHFSGVGDLHPPPFTQSSAKMTPLPSPDTDDHLTVQSSNIQEQRQLQPLTAGRKYELPCRAYGSRPPAKLTWWMDGRRLDTTRETTSSDGNSTTSVLTFIPVKPNKLRYQEPGERNLLKISDYDGKLTCRAENPQHQQQSTSQRKNTIATGSDDAGTPFIQSTWLLRIQYVPETQITLGTNLRADDIREGTDVYFDCTVDAVPPAYKVQWKRDGIELHHNAGSGGSISGSGTTATIIISNQSLVLQGVSRREAGHYTCGAENAEGPGPHSKSIYLDVLYPPTCTPSNSANSNKAIQRVVYGVAKKETVTIACHVQANPPPTEYRWSFNNTISSIATSSGAGPSSAGSLIKQRFSNLGHLAGSSLNSSRILTYAPRTDFDYGTVECWARNRVGMQSHPCVYHVIAAGRPDRVTNCTVINSKAAISHNGTKRLRTSRNSGSHIIIRCTEGYDGGLPQHLWAEIREATKTQLSDIGDDDLNGILVQNITGIDEQDHQNFSDFNQEENKKLENVASPPIKVFVARGLKLGGVYRVDVIASNAKGRSEPLTLMISVPLHGMTGMDADESNQNGISNTMTTIEGQDPDRARNLLLEQQRELERDRRLQEDNVTDIGNFRMTPAMAIVLLVAGSLVVIACGVATFLRYRKDDEEDGADGGNGETRNFDRDQIGSANGPVETRIGTTCISNTPHRNAKTMTTEQLLQQTNGAKVQQNNIALHYKNTVVGNNNKTTAVDKEYHGGDGSGDGGIGCLRNSISNAAIYRSDASTGASPSHVTPTGASVARGMTPCSANAYATIKSSQIKNCSSSFSAAAPATNDQPGRVSLQQSYHRNPDIIPAPLQMMSPNTVYNHHKELGDPSTDSMTLIVASSTSSSPIHNHRQQQFYHNRGYNSSLQGQYHQGVMTFRQPVVINTQYYGGGRNTLHRNSLQQPSDPIVMVNDASSVGGNNYPLTMSSPAAAYCTLPRTSSYHNQNHNLQQQHWLHQQQANYHRQPADSEVDAVEPPPPPWPSQNRSGTNFPTVILVPSPPLPSPPPAQPSSTAMVQVPVVINAVSDKQPQITSNKKESAV